MQIEGFNTCKCGNDNFFLRKEGTQYGIYCQKCGKWLKWANKNERTLFEEENSEQNLQALREMLEDVNPEEIALILQIILSVFGARLGVVPLLCIQGGLKYERT